MVNEWVDLHFVLQNFDFTTISISLIIGANQDRAS